MKLYILLTIVVLSMANSTLFNCVDQSSCSLHGMCNKNKTACICNDGYITHKSNNQCNYLQKEQLIALLLSIFLGIFAAGQWYVANYFLAGPKLLMTLVGCCLLGSLRFDNNKEIKIICVLLFLFAIFAWLITDIIIFSMNNYTDGNGVVLKPILL